MSKLHQSHWLMQHGWALLSGSPSPASGGWRPVNGPALQCRRLPAHWMMVSGPRSGRSVRQHWRNELGNLFFNSLTWTVRTGLCHSEGFPPAAALSFSLCCCCLSDVAILLNFLAKKFALFLLKTDFSVTLGDYNSQYSCSCETFLSQLWMPVHWESIDLDVPQNISSFKHEHRKACWWGGYSSSHDGVSTLHPDSHWMQPDNTEQNRWSTLGRLWKNGSWPIGKGIQTEKYERASHEFPVFFLLLFPSFHISCLHSKAASTPELQNS